MQFHDKLFMLRKEKGLTQADLAEKLEVSRQSVSKWEMGTAIPDLDRIRKISRFFSVSVDYLVNDDVDCESEVLITKETASVLKINYNFLPKRAIVALCVVAVTAIIAMKTNSIFGMALCLSIIGFIFLVYYGIRLFFLFRKKLKEEGIWLITTILLAITSSASIAVIVLLIRFVVNYKKERR